MQLGQETISTVLQTVPDQSKDPAVCYLAAMSHWQSDNPLEAHDWFDKAEALLSTTTAKPDVNVSPIRDEAVNLMHGESID